MTVKELSNLYWLNGEIAEEKRKLEELMTATQNITAKITGLPHVCGVSDKVGSYAVLVAEQSELINLKVKQSIIEYNKLNRYIASIDDSFIRQVISFRFVNGLTWQQVANHIGGNNTEDSVKKACYRYLDKSCPTCPELK